MSGGGGGRLKGGLYRSYAEKEKERERQAALKAKHGVEGENVVVVEKSAAPRVALHIAGTLLRVLLAIAVFSFAVLGLLSMLYPAPREAMLETLAGIRDSAYSYAPFLKDIAALFGG